MSLSFDAAWGENDEKNGVALDTALPTPRQLSLSVALNHVPPNPEALPAVCAEAVVDLCRAIACTAARSRLELHRMPNRTVKVALLQALVKALCTR